MIVQKITVVLADDHTIVRQGLRKLLEAEGDIEVVGEAETGREAVKLANKLKPHVVVMDIAMPLLNGLEATRQITKETPRTHVLMLSGYDDDEYVEKLTALGYGEPLFAAFYPNCLSVFGLYDADYRLQTAK